MEPVVKRQKSIKESPRVNTVMDISWEINGMYQRIIKLYAMNWMIS